MTRWHDRAFEGSEGLDVSGEPREIVDQYGVLFGGTVEKNQEIAHARAVCEFSGDVVLKRRNDLEATVFGKFKAPRTLGRQTIPFGGLLVIADPTVSYCFCKMLNWFHYRLPCDVC